MTPEKETPTPKTVEEELERYKQMWDAGEFEFNHHPENPLGTKPINPQRIWNVYIQPLMTAQNQAADERLREVVQEILSCKREAARELEAVFEPITAFQSGEVPPTPDIKTRHLVFIKPIDVEKIAAKHGITNL